MASSSLTDSPRSTHDRALQYVLFSKASAPRPITAENAKSWAHASVVERLPAILQKVLSFTNIPAAFAGLNAPSMSLPYSNLISPAFVNKISLALRENGTLPLLVGGPHKERYNAIIEGVRTHHFPWLMLEAVFYRLVMDECNYWEKKIDPFRPQKLQSLVDAEAVVKHIDVARSQFDHPSVETIANLLNFCLWSNAADLSRHPEGVDASLAENVFSTSSAQTKKKILINNMDAILSLLRSIPVQDSPPKSPKKVIIITDNAGVEFISDLLWADVLVSSKRIHRVDFHVKLHPTFVSDVTKADVEDTLAFMERVAPSIGKRFRTYFKKGIFTVLDHFYYNAYEPYWIVPLDLYNDYQSSEFVISKGDANARRFHGDRMWDFTTPTQSIISYFPVPLLLIRTFKSETVSGVTPEIIEQLVSALKNDWYHSGEFGTLQLIVPPYDLQSPVPLPKSSTRASSKQASAAKLSVNPFPHLNSLVHTNLLDSPSTSHSHDSYTNIPSTETSEVVDVDPTSPSPISLPLFASRPDVSLSECAKTDSLDGSHNAGGTLRSASHDASSFSPRYPYMEDSDTDPLEIEIRELMHDGDHSSGSHKHKRSRNSSLSSAGLDAPPNDDSPHSSPSRRHHHRHHHHHHHRNSTHGSSSNHSETHGHSHHSSSASHRHRSQSQSQSLRD